jgi:sugar-phosphatase
MTTHPRPADVLAAVLFDLDGTLVDSTAADLRSWLQWLDEYDIPRSRLGDWHGRPARQVVAELLEPGYRDEDLDLGEQRIEKLQIENSRDVLLLPGARDALDALNGSGRVAVVTSCSRALATARIAAAGLPAPAVVVTVDDVSRGKPDPEPFRTAAVLLGQTPARCLAVEDAPAGVASAHGAGCSVLTVGRVAEADLPQADFSRPHLGAVRFTIVGDGISLSLTSTG